MTNTKEIILKLKEVRDEKKLSFQNIIDLMEHNGDYISKSTLSRLFSEGSEEMKFSYDDTLRPIAKVLLDIETIDADDELDVQAMKSLLKYKMERITELEKQVAKLEKELDKEQIKYHEKLEKERDRSRKSIEFLKNQINLKDKRMDQLLEAVFVKDDQHKKLLEQFLTCPCRIGKNTKEE